MFSLLFLLISNPIPIRSTAADKCDLVIYHGDIIASDYPRKTPAGLEEDISVTVRNNGATASDRFTLRVTITGTTGTSVINLHCDGLQPGENQVYDLVWSASWFTPPGEIIIEAAADPAEVCDDCWRPNNTGSITKTLFDIYPSEAGWPITPLQVVKWPPLLINLDSDPELEVVILSGTFLEAYDYDNTLLWRYEKEPLRNFVSPLAADLDGDGSIEIIAMTSSSDIAVFNEDGELIYLLDELELEHYSRLAVADMVPLSGLEMVVSDHETLNLYSWDPAAEEFTWIDSTAFSYPKPPNRMVLLCNDLNEDGYSETVYYCGYFGPVQPPPFYSIAVYDWRNSTTLSERTWDDENFPPVIPCAGILGGSAEVGFPMRSYDPQSAKEDSVPAQLLDPLSLDSILCEKGLVASRGLKFGLFADWDEFVPGLDAFIIPAENQCLAWNNLGNHLPVGNWPITYDDQYEYSTAGIRYPALGDLDGDGTADVLSSTRRSGNGLVIGMDYRGFDLENLDFPFLLPEGVGVRSGFSIADIDRDGKVEIVFGTSDGLLHCWEFGSCAVGYAPWPQHRHDAGRSGVLE
jgi:hypothetical protein